MWNSFLGRIACIAQFAQLRSRVAHLGTRVLVHLARQRTSRQRDSSPRRSSVTTRVKRAQVLQTTIDKLFQRLSQGQAALRRRMVKVPRTRHD